MKGGIEPKGSQAPCCSQGWRNHERKTPSKTDPGESPLEKQGLEKQVGPGLRQGLGDREETLGVKAANKEPALVIHQPGLAGSGSGLPRTPSALSCWPPGS